MSDEVDWVLDELGSVVDDIATNYTTRNGDSVTVRRVDRDDSDVYDGSGTVDVTTPIHTRKGALEKGVYVSASLVDRDPTPIGTEYDHRLETVVNVRIEGLTSRGGNWGHVDPDGVDGVPFGVLTRKVRRTLLASRSYPAVAPPDTTYQTLSLTNDTDRSDEWADFYFWTGDFVFTGYEDLP